MPLEFVPNSGRYPSLLFNGYIFLKSRQNANGSINWRCQNYNKKGDLHCNVTCTTMNDEFSRPPPMLHLKDDGTLKHRNVQESRICTIKSFVRCF